MKTAFSPLFILLIFVASAAWAGKEKGLIAGRIIDKGTGSPVKNVTVQLLTNEGNRFVPVGGRTPTYEVKSKSGGRFVFEHVPAGEWHVGVRDAKMAPAELDLAAKIGPKRKVQGLVLKVCEGASLEGGVYSDEDFEKGVADLVLEGSCYDSENKLSRVFRATTDAQGKFRLGGLPMGEYRLEPATQQLYVKCSMVFMNDDAFHSDIIPILGREHLTQVEFQVKPSSFSQRGMVVGEDGKPVSGAEVGEGSRDFRVIEKLSTLTRTDSDGRFVLRELHEERGYLVARFGDSLAKPTPYSAVPVTENREGEPCTLKLIKLGRIRGRVVDTHGNAIKEAELWLEPLVSPGKYELDKTLKTDLQGRFDTGPLLDGKYCFVVYGPAHEYIFVDQGKLELNGGQIIDDYTITVKRGTKEGK